MSELTVTLSDVFAAGYCASGARKWFALNSMDFRTFARNGIPAETMLAVGDHYAIKVVAAARRRVGGENG